MIQTQNCTIISFSRSVARKKWSKNGKSIGRRWTKKETNLADGKSRSRRSSQKHKIKNINREETPTIKNEHNSSPFIWCERVNFWGLLPSRSLHVTIEFHSLVSVLGYKAKRFQQIFFVIIPEERKKREQERIWDEKDQRKALWVNGGFGACLLIIAIKLSCSDNFSCRRRWFFALLVIDPCKGKLLWLHDCLQTVLAFQLPSSTSLMIVLDCLARYFVYCFPSTTRTPIRKTKGNKLNGSCRK